MFTCSLKQDIRDNQKDFDHTLIIDNRTARVAKWISDYLKASGDRFQKTIVFCVDTPHAARMRQALINENADLVKRYPRYVMHITGDDPKAKNSSAISLTPSPKCQSS